MGHGCLHLFLSRPLFVARFRGHGFFVFRKVNRRKSFRSQRPMFRTLSPSASSLGLGGITDAYTKNLHRFMVGVGLMQISDIPKRNTICLGFGRILPRYGAKIGRLSEYLQIFIPSYSASIQEDVPAISSPSSPRASPRTPRQSSPPRSPSSRTR